MSEKKGNTVKIIYDFESWRCLEIYVESMQKWHRVTPREFRAYSGKRRITTWDKDNNPNHKEYNGPVYMFETNHIYKGKDKGYIYPQDYVRKSRPRPGEGHLV